MYTRPCSHCLLTRLTTFCGCTLLGLANVSCDRGSVQHSYSDAISTLNAAKDEYSRWCALNAAAKESFNSQHYADARRYAGELEKLAPKYRNDWNYGNAVQDFNIVLGRLALKSGDIAAAKDRLLAAGHSPGSAQMDSFGPNVALAKELLGRGEKEVVLQYLELCRSFWAKHPETDPLDKRHGETLDHWKSDIEKGQTPDFGANLGY